jgi:hypothetical protein
MKTRRRFVMLMPWVPLAGVSLLAACSDKAPPPAASPAPAPAPAPSPAPSPAAVAEPAAPTTASAPTLVSPSDPQAQTLGYVPLSSQADGMKYKTHAASQNCSNCALYTGKAGEAAGPCPLFAGRLVSAEGWCSAWAKKA